MLNLCLCIDLILTIYDPFSPAYRRTKMYYLFSIASSVVLVMVIYYVTFVVVSIKTKDPNMFVDNAYPIFVFCNSIAVGVALNLYAYSICLAKKAINESSNYNFTYRHSYIMVTLYVLLIVLECIYLLTFKVFDDSIVVVTMLRIVAFILMQFTIFQMVLKSG